MPTRLLDVGFAEKTGAGAVRLIESTLLSKIEPYVALSYCWGTASQVKTEKGNIERRKAGIELAILPKTIQDSIRVTLELGRRFIWIDALCIIQDDRDDWAREAAQMAQVYSNAELTISASRASSAVEGFLTSNATNTISEFQTQWTLEDGSSTTLKARSAIYSQTHHYNRHKGVNLSPEDPLNKRAWTLQEGLLSTRSVIFTQQEIEWQCKSQRTCQCGYLNNLNHDFRKISLFRLDSPTYAFSFWQKMIEENYSKRSLTFRKDKLPSLSGVASVIQQVTGSVYLAGMWKDNIIQDLSWRVEVHSLDKYTRLTPRPDEYRSIPSFSWASSDDNVYFVGLSIPMFSVVDAGVTLTSGNTLGEVEQGWITLKGRAVSAEMRLINWPAQPQPPSADIRVPGFHSEGDHGFFLYRMDLDHTVRCFSFTDANGNRRRATASPYVTNSTAVSGSKGDIQWDPNDDMWSQVFPVKIMLLGDGHRLEASQRISLGLYLVLGVSPEDPHDTYERIGLASITNQNLGDGFWRFIRRGEEWAEEYLKIV